MWSFNAEKKNDVFFLNWNILKKMLKTLIFIIIFIDICFSYKYIF